MSENWLELAIIAFIVLGMMVAIWRGGAQNPVSTGSLNRKFGKMATDLGALKTEVDAMNIRVTEIDRRGATSDDIRGIERKLEEQAKCLSELDDGQTAIREMAASRGAKLDATHDLVGRLYDVLVPRGLGK